VTSEIPWEKIRAEHSSSSKPYMLIGKVLVEKCFTNEVSVIKEILHQSLPLLDVALKRFLIIFFLSFKAFPSLFILTILNE
jgi:hypothetical protein